MLVGYSLYDEDGRLIEGNMPNQGSWNRTIPYQNASVNIPMGYHDGNGKVTASVPTGHVSTPSTVTINAGVPGIIVNNSNGYVRVASSVGQQQITPVVNTPGYVTTNEVTGAMVSAMSQETGKQLPVSANSGIVTTLTSPSTVTLVNVGQFATGNVEVNVKEGLVSTSTKNVVITNGWVNDRTININTIANSAELNVIVGTTYSGPVVNYNVKATVTEGYTEGETK